MHIKRRVIIKILSEEGVAKEEEEEEISKEWGGRQFQGEKYDLHSLDIKATAMARVCLFKHTTVHPR